MPLHDLIALLALGILDDQTSLRAFHEHDEQDQHDNQGKQRDNEKGRHRILSRLTQEVDNRGRHFCDNARKDYE